MPRFFLHLRTSEGLNMDGKGVELAHLGDLRKSASKIAVDLLADNPGAADWRFEVEDETGRTVFTERLGDLIPSQSG